MYGGSVIKPVDHFNDDIITFVHLQRRSREVPVNEDHVPLEAIGRPSPPRQLERELCYRLAERKWKASKEKGQGKGRGYKGHGYSAHTSKQARRRG